MKLPSDQDSTGRCLGDDELALLSQVIRSGTLTSTKGTMVPRLEESFAARLGARHAFACASGSAAVHAAIAAVDPEPGDEIVTSPITDMGAIAPILYQGAVPVFADVDADTATITADTIRARLSPRTRAIVVTHLFGRPCDMDPILDLGRERGVPVIEDCAQAFLARHRGRYAGRMGAIGCFSLQQGKHMTCGEGGLVTTDDPEIARRLFLFINKAWGYGDPEPDHYFLALNYRMSELQGAVALAQLGKLGDAVDRRIAAARALASRLEGTEGVRLPAVPADVEHTYWRVALIVDAAVVRGGTVALARSLAASGIASAPRYIQKPAFRCALFRDRRTFGRSGYPFTLARPEAVDYGAERFRGTFAALERLLVLPWNELYREEHAAHVADSIRSALRAIR